MPKLVVGPNVGPIDLASKLPINDNNVSNYLDERSINSVFLDSVNGNEVEFEIRRRLSKHMSCGHDEIHLIPKWPPL